MYKKMFLILFLAVNIFVYSKSSEEIRIGISLSNLENPFFKEMKEGIEERARREGMTVEVLSAKDSPVEELRHIEGFISEGVDVMIINPVNSYAVSRGIALANEAKIPVITIDRESFRGDVASHIGSNNLSGGKLLARYLIATLGSDASVVELEGKADTTASENRGRGFNQVATGKLSVIVREDVDFEREKGYFVMKRILREEPVIDGVFAHNDESALGALKAVEESGRNIAVVGYDGTEEALKAVDEGRLAATIKQNPYDMGYMGMETALKTVNGVWVNRKIDIGVYLIDKETLAD